MRCTLNTFLLTALALVAISGSIASATEANRLNVQVARLLRGTETNSGTVAAEDRGFAQFALADLKAKFKIKDLRINAWLALGKTDDQVMKTLGIPKGLSRADLEKHPKFSTLEKFQVNKWLQEGATTFKVWDDLGFNNVLGNVENADGYRTYMRFVWALGNKVDKYFRGEGKAPVLERIVNPREIEATERALKYGNFDEMTISQVLNAFPLV